MEWTKDFSLISKNDALIAGGKGASLGEMTQAKIPVPPGFVVLTSAFQYFLKTSDIGIEIDALLKEVDINAIHTVEEVSAQIQALILEEKSIPLEIETEILSSFKALNTEFVAVRSSATAEDGASSAWAGQLDSYLNTTEETLLKNIRRCWASLFTPRAIFYRFEKELDQTDISVAVVVQKMVNSDSAGIAFSVHPVTEDRNQIIIEAGFGLGEAVVSGQITPDSYVVTKEPREIIDKNVIEQSKGLFRKEGGGNEWKEAQNGKEQVLSDNEILKLSETILTIENHYGFPCDIEWAKEGSEIYIVQSRPITTLSGETNNNNGVVRILKKAEDTNYSANDYYFLYQTSGFPRFYADLCVRYYGGFNALATCRDGVFRYYVESGDKESKTVSEIEEIYGSKKEFNEKCDHLYKQLSELSGKVTTLTKLKPDKEILKEFFDFVGESFNLYALFDHVNTDNLFTKNTVENAKELIEIVAEHKNKIRERFDEEFFASNSTLSMFFKWLADVYNTTPEHITECTTEELLSLVETQKIPDVDGENFVLVGNSNVSVDLVGAPAKEFIKKFEATVESKDTTTLNGVTVYGSGTVQGKVRVIDINYQNLEKSLNIINNNEESFVFVAESTLPEMIPAMKKALAIVTDVGGVLSHAAITARELKKMCLIGTQVATQVLKDGDLVEVDANEGVVRILERKEGEQEVFPKDVLALDWSLYLSRPFSLFMSSVWFTWYSSKEIRKILGVNVNKGLYLQEDDGLVQHYQLQTDKDALEKAYSDLIKERPEEALIIVRKGEKLNVVAEKVLQIPLKKDEFLSEIKFLEDLAWYAAIFPAFFAKECEEQSLDRKEVEDISHKLRMQSLYPKIMERMLIFLEKDLQDKGISNPKRAIKRITLNEYLKDDRKLIESRLAQPESQFVLYCDKNYEHVFWGSNAEEIYSSLHNDDNENSIIGQVSFKGKVTGTARVIRDFSKQKNNIFNKGDVLVSVNSNPEMLHWIKKSSALVTDEGGIICHAAIVSRELKKPCIIGTKNATRKIKDGDLVEVDANEGVVRILDKK